MLIRFPQRLAKQKTRWLAPLSLSCLLLGLANTSHASCTYKIGNEWDTGFIATITVANTGTSAVSQWSLGWQYSGPNRILHSWNGNLSGNNPYTVTGLSWNSNLQPGQSAEFGFQGAKNGSTVEIPVLSGTLCGGTNPSSSSIPSSSSVQSSSIISSSKSSLISSSLISSSLRSSSSVLSSSSSSKPSSSSSKVSSSSSSSVINTTGDWLHVAGNRVLDNKGRAVWMTGANWFGFNASERVFHGLWSGNLTSIMQDMANHGINLLRVPISTELLYEWKNGVFKATNVNTYANPELEGLNSLQIFDKTLEIANRVGMKVLLDVHSARADNSGHIAPLWYDATFTEAIFYETWEWVANRYKNNDTLIAFDLENEPHGKAHTDTAAARWDNSNHVNNWKRVAQEASRRILAIHPNVLILIEGVEVFPKDGINWESKSESDYFFTWWGGNLRGVKNYPVQVSGHQSQIMYSPHDYGPAVWPQSWFYDGFNKETLIKDTWYDNWLYIHDTQIAPLLIGEWGGFMDGGKNQAWMGYLRDLLVEKKIHHTFWCLNPNSGDTGGLLNNDWATWDAAKYALFKTSLWTTSNGKFVGLDQDTPLGVNGVSVSQYYSSGGAEPIGQ